MQKLNFVLYATVVPMVLERNLSLRNLGVKTSFDLCSDSSSGGSFASRKGLGRQRHVQQDIPGYRREWHASIFERIRTEENTADMLMKAVGLQVIEKHLKILGFALAKP